MTEKWKDGWLWIQITPDGKWERAMSNEVISALVERVERLESPVAQAVDMFDAKDFAYVAKALRYNHNTSAFETICSNNFGIILAALDKASGEVS